MQDLATTFAGYRLHETIGRDAVSTTYRATPSDRDAAGGTVVLQVSAPLTDGVERRRATLIQRKATAAMDVEHRGIAQVLDVGIIGDRAYAATAWRPSVTLDQLIGQRWRLSRYEVATMLMPAAEGLDTAHAAGVVHGALGTRSIRVTTDARPTAFVTGFGFDALLALRLSSKGERDAWPVLNDLLYAAPEQLRGGRVEPATDQYALACALFHCMTGEPPFIRETASALFGAHLFARPPIHDVLTDPDNAAAHATIATGLAKTPEERHSSCAALLRATDIARSGAVPAAPTAVGRSSAATAAGATPPADPARSTEPDRAATTTPAVLALLQRVPIMAFVLVAAVAGLIAALSLIATTRGDGTDAAQAGAAQDAARDQIQDREQDDGTVPEQVSTAGPAVTTVAWRRPVVDGRVSLVTAADDAVVAVADSAVAAVDPVTGDERWRVTVDGGEVTDVTITDDAVVYRTATELHALALDDGRRMWRRDDPYTPTGGLAAVTDGLLYGMGPGRILPELMAMDPATGVEQWHFHGEEVPARQNATVAADDTLVTILQNGTLFGLDPESELYPSGADRRQIEDEVFRIDVARPWRDSLMLHEDTVLLARRNGAVCSLARADAARRWCRRIDGVRDAPPRLLAGGDTVVVVTRSTVTALDRATGAPSWSAPATERITAATTTGTAVVVADRGGGIRALDVASGDERWRADGPTTVTSLASADDAVFAGTRDGAVLRLEPADPAS